MCKPQQRRYLLVTTVETTRTEADGSTTVLPAGAVLNEVLWDGATSWTPPEGTAVVPPPGA